MRARFGRRLFAVVVVLAALVAVLAVAGCGDDSSDDSGSASTTTAATTTAEATTAASTAEGTATGGGPGEVVEVTLGSPQPFSLVPSVTSVPAGEVTFDVVNEGSMVHEMVVVPAPDGVEALRQPDGSASEEGALGEVADLEAGASGTLTVDMPAGDYVLLCNLPGHFAGGMWAEFTVT